MLNFQPLRKDNVEKYLMTIEKTGLTLYIQ